MFMVCSMNPTPTQAVAAPELIARIIFALCQTLTARLRVGSVTPAGLTYIVGRAALNTKTRRRRSEVPKIAFAPSRFCVF